MKKVLTLIVCEKTQCVPAQSMFDGLDIAVIGENDDRRTFTAQAVKNAKGKYCALIDADFSYADVHSFLLAADESGADVLKFRGGYCFKTSILRGLDLRDFSDRYCAEFIAAMNCKSVAEMNIKPFVFRGVNTEYSKECESALCRVLDEFSKNKAKLTKEVYLFTFDAICSRLITFYISAALAVRDKKAEAENLENLDKKVKENIVLYLALEKRSGERGIDLKKLREKKFIIPFFSVGKYKALLKQPQYE